MLLEAAVVLALGALSVLPKGSPQSPPSGVFVPAEWVIVGPFPNGADPNAEPGEPERAGYEVDYLASMGGEAAAKPAAGAAVAGQPGASAQAVRPGPLGFVNLAALFAEPANKVAYAYGVIESESDQTAIVHFGSDDSPKVWVNGKLVHRLWVPGGRAAVPWQDEFPIELRKGRNDVLLKIDNGTGDWSFYFEAYTAEAHREALAKQGIQRLPAQKLVSTAETGFVLAGPTFPSVSFADPALIATFLKDVKPTVRWFNDALEEVGSAEKPGLYLGYVEARTIDGMALKSFVPVYRPRDPNLLRTVAWPPEGAFATKLSPDKSLGIDPARWKAVQPALDGFGAQVVWREFSQTPAGAALLAFIESEDQPAATRPDDPFRRLLDRELALKRKLYGVTGRAVRLVKRSDQPGRVLRSGKPAEAGMAPDIAAKLDRVCREWTKAEGRPFTVLVARHGVVFFHSAYGELNGVPIKKDALFYPASIGKVMCGLVFGMFMDQGLLDPDTPIGRYLPDWPTEGPKAVTFRNCFTHTSGIAGHGTYDGLWNPFLDNAFAVGHLGGLSPSTRHAYGGDGNNLAAKAMELVAGRPFVRILQEDLFGPIGAKVDQDDLGWINTTTAFELAKIAQMMLNRGTYGEHRFFSPKTFERMLPVKLSTFYPKLDNQEIEWGLCMTHMTDPDDATRADNPLGPNVIGHGSASSSILRVDLDHDLLVVMGRYGIGDAKAHGEYRGKFMKALRDALAD